MPRVRGTNTGAINNNNNDNHDKILIKREPLVYARARGAVQKNNNNNKIFRLGQYKLKNKQTTKQKTKNLTRQQRQ